MYSDRQNQAKIPHISHALQP